MLTVTIRELRADTALRRTWRSRHRTTDPGVAIDRALGRHFGKRAFFQPDLDVRADGTWYGQVFEDVSAPGEPWAANSLTGRVRVDVRPARIADSAQATAHHPA